MRGNTWEEDAMDDTDAWDSTWSNNIESMNSCLEPGETTYIFGILIQILFIFIYGFIYHCYFKENDSVTKTHMFVLYINSTFWGWAVYLFLYKVVCGGFNGTDIFITGCVFMGISFFCSCIELCCSREGGYFRHQKTMQECIQYMNKMKETAPVHRVEIECYHNVTDYERDRRGRVTRTSERKVITYREWRDFLYDRWIDDSDYPNLPEISMATPIVAVESTTSVEPGDDFTHRQFNNFRTNFVEQNRFRDWYIDETVRTLIPGHEATVTAKSEKENEVPWWLNSGLFCLLGVFFCSCPLRVLFRSQSKRHTFVIRKSYFVDAEGPNFNNMGVNVTINVSGNQGTVNIGTNSEGMPVVQQGAPNAPPPYQPYGAMQENPPYQPYGTMQEGTPYQPYGTMQEGTPYQPYGTMQEGTPYQPYGTMQEGTPYQPYGTMQEGTPYQPYGTMQEGTPYQPYGTMQENPPYQPYGTMQEKPPHQPYGTMQEKTPYQPYRTMQEKPNLQGYPSESDGYQHSSEPAPPPYNPNYQ